MTITTPVYVLPFAPCMVQCSHAGQNHTCFTAGILHCQSVPQLVRTHLPLTRCQQEGCPYLHPQNTNWLMMEEGCCEQVGTACLAWEGRKTKWATFSRCPNLPDFNPISTFILTDWKSLISPFIYLFVCLWHTHTNTLCMCGRTRVMWDKQKDRCYGYTVPREPLSAFWRISLKSIGGIFSFRRDRSHTYFFPKMEHHTYCYNRL